MGPRHHGRPGAGLQSWRRHRSSGRHKQGVVVGPGAGQRGLVPRQLCSGKGEQIFPLITKNWITVTLSHHYYIRLESGVISAPVFFLPSTLVKATAQ